MVSGFFGKSKARAGAPVAVRRAARVEARPASAMHGESAASTFGFRVSGFGVEVRSSGCRCVHYQEETVQLREESMFLQSS